MVTELLPKKQKGKTRKGREEIVLGPAIRVTYIFAKLARLVGA